MSNISTKLKRLKMKFRSAEFPQEQEKINQDVFDILSMMSDTIDDLEKEIKELKGKKDLKSRVVELENKLKNLERKK